MPPRKGSTTEKKQTKRKKPSVENSDESSEEEVLTKKSKKKEAKTSSAEANSEGPLVDTLDFSCDCKTSEGEPWNFKITAWNINGIRAWINKNGIDFLKKEDPDIFCVMETKCSTEKMPAEVEVNGYTTYWLSGDKEGYSGVGIYTKTKPINVTYGIGLKKHDEDGRVITAEYNKFYLVAAYVPNAGRKLVRLDYRMQWDVDFRNYLITLDKKKPLILCGDLNVAHQEIDLKNPKTNKKTAGFTQEERDGFTKLLESGFVDSFRHLHPDEKDAYTFWTYMMNARAKNVGWRLDYFVLSKALLPSLCENVIRKDVYGSDHCPLTLFLAL